MNTNEPLWEQEPGHHEMYAYRGGGYIKVWWNRNFGCYCTNAGGRVTRFSDDTTLDEAKEASVVIRRMEEAA